MGTSLLCYVCLCIAFAAPSKLSEATARCQITLLLLFVPSPSLHPSAMPKTAQFAQPPYTNEHNIEAGAMCYMCDYKYQGTTWTGLMRHITRCHHVPNYFLQGSWLWEATNAEKVQQQRARRSKEEQDATGGGEGVGIGECVAP